MSGALAKIRCCDASGCRGVGGTALREALESARQDLGLSAQEVAIQPVGCLRLCGRGPLVAVDAQDHSTSLYGGVPTDLASDLVRQAVPASAGPEPGVSRLAAHWIDPAHPFFALQQPVVLEGCGRVNPESIQDALAAGTYAQFQRCLQELTPEQVREQVKRSGLRGRGGGGYPTGLKWDTVALQPPGPRYVVCNADEGDPGAFMDRSVLESDPHRLLEGLAIAAFAVGASKGYVYVRAEYPLAIERVRLAIRQARHEGWLGEGIAGSNVSLSLEVRVGAGAYVCGEETALLHSIQGERGTPCPRPPYP
ncbi:MAG: NADH-quinone oxidoreductase subunit L, partial [Cyanobacteriota bacterium]